MKKKEFWTKFFFGKKNINNPQNMSSIAISFILVIFLRSDFIS